MKLILKSLSIINFKGIANLTLHFNEKENFIFGRNGAGKTTISDAYHWLMTGKDSTDAKEFEIKPIDTEGKRSERLDNEVSAIIIVDGIEIAIKKVHSEKWVKAKGSPIAEFKGNETTYFWNGAPITMKEYQGKLNEIIPDSKLKLFSNTGYFNSLNWTDRRAVLIDMAGGIDRDALISSDKNFAFIGEFLGQNKSFKEFKAQVSNDKKRAKEELDQIPSRIDEVKRNNANLERPFGRLKDELAKHKAELEGIERSISDKQEAYNQQDLKIQNLRKQKYELEQAAINVKDALATSISASLNKPDEGKIKLQQELSEVNMALGVAKSSIDLTCRKIQNGTDKINDASKEIETLNAEIDSLREQWKAENKVQFIFDEDNCICPTCRRELDESDISTKREQYLQNFNNDKQHRLSSLVGRSEVKKSRLNSICAEVEQYKAALTELINQQAEENAKEDDLTVKAQDIERQLINYTNELQEASESKEVQLQNTLYGHAEYNELVAKAAAINEELSEFKPIDNAALISRKKELSELIETINKDLLNEGLIKSNHERVEELKAQESTLAQRIADLEMKEFYFLQFNLKQMDKVEKSVNKMFGFVQFRMFDQQINGEIKEDCKTLVDGKPIDGNAVNTASVINAGVDIINTLSKHYNTYVPMFIDGRESVTDLLPTSSQSINLIVSPAHQQLELVGSMDEVAVA